MTKKELIEELQKLGIDANHRQKKDELERMYELAKAARKQIRPNRVYKPQFKEEGRRGRRGRPLTAAEKNTARLFGLGFIGLLILLIVVLFTFNTTFKRNVFFLAEKLGVGAGTEALETEPETDPDSEEGQSTDGGPRIYEKNNQTYVVYDFPLVGVDIVYDQKCDRDACNLDAFLQQIKSNISPLVKFNFVDYKSGQGQNMIQRYDVAALPVFVFDEHLHKTENFDKVQHFFSLVENRYILQAEPYKILTGPDLNNAHFKGAPPEESEIILIEYSSFSCPHCQQALELVNQIKEQYQDKITVYFKHFDRGGNDTLVAQASECAAEQGNFWQMHEKLFENQEAWVGETDARVKSLLRRYAANLRLNSREFNECINSERHLDIIKAHTEEAQRLGVENLPTFLLNQDILTGIYPLEQFEAWIETALKEQE